VPWLLCDYGQVLSQAPPTDDWESLCREAGYDDASAFHDAYWRHRPEYDRADLTAHEYWSLVARPASDFERLVEKDVGIWLHADQPSVDAAVRAAQRGFRLALFSNAPLEVAAGIDALEWMSPFERRFYSCHLRSIKPSRSAYTQVLDALDARPEDVWFFDDRAVNVDAALELGWRAELYRSPEQFEALRAE
jgi:putative hydrolase of the HAD superfamily